MLFLSTEIKIYISFIFHLDISGDSIPRDNLIKNVLKEISTFNNNSYFNGSCFEFSTVNYQNSFDLLEKGCESVKSGLSLFISNAYSCKFNVFTKSFTQFFNIPNIIFPSECNDADWTKIIFSIIYHLNATDVILVYDRSIGNYTFV